MSLLFWVLLAGLAVVLLAALVLVLTGTKLRTVYVPRDTTVGENAQTLREMVSKAFPALTEAGVPFVLNGGSAIGYFRYRGVLPNDDDVDVTVPASTNMHKLALKLRELLPADYEVEEGVQECITKIKWRDGAIDVIQFDDDGLAKGVCRMFWPNERVNNDQFDSRIAVKFEGTDAFVFPDVLKYLENAYPGWRKHVCYQAPHTSSFFTMVWNKYVVERCSKLTEDEIARTEAAIRELNLE